MTDDKYQLVESSDHTLSDYPCGVCAGDRLSLKNDLVVQDENGNPSGEVIRAGSIWTVVAGLPAEPDVVWLEQPNGETHTWDVSLLEDFDRSAPDAA